MINLERYLKAINYRVTEGTEFQWKCFGPGARYLDSSQGPGYETDWTVSAVFDQETQQVFMMEVWDQVNSREYRWIDPNWLKEFQDEARERNLDPDISIDKRQFIDCDLADDILEKITNIVRGQDYDQRIQVELDIEDDMINELMRRAHEQDITLNQLVNNILEQELKNAV